jgi:ABC-type multidrug transport system ATPase subunit
VAVRLSSPVAAREVRKRFGRWSPWVLDGVDLTLEPGSTTVVVGANGSGKSTLLRIIAGLTPPSSGRVERSEASSIGYAPDRLGARVRMSARVYVEHMARLRGCSPDVARDAMHELFGVLGLLPGPDAPIRSLSRGNSQKVALTQAFIAPVDLLLLDEPYGGLDEGARAAVSALVADRVGRGAAVVITAHQPVDALVADRTVQLAGGRLEVVESVVVLLVRIVVVGDADPAALESLRALAGVVRFIGSGGSASTSASATLDVEAAVSDEVLRFALAHGWSVASVVPVAVPRPGDDGLGGS